MNILDQFERKTIQVRGLDGIESHVGWCYGEIYLLPCYLDGVDHWCLGCIPIGASFPSGKLGLYRNIEDACGAAIAMARANNNWAGVERFGPREWKIMEDICEKFNGFTDVYLSPNYAIPTGDKLFLNGASQQDLQ